LALIDFCLPDMEGTKVLKTAKNASIKIMLTGKEIPLPRGVDLLLKKPIAPDKLLSLIDSKLKDANLEIYR
jgi:DNA-binding response OmpR family regulator